MANTSEMNRYAGGFSKWGLMILSTIIVLYFFAVMAPFTTIYDNYLDLFVRIFALTGYISLFLASMLSLYLREVRIHFNRPFLRVHHVFAAIGIMLITAHPVVFAISAANIAVFIPDFSSWYAFWSLAGRPALYIIYFAALTAFFRTRIRTSWRYFHGLMYVSLFFAYVHGFLIGANFANPVISLLFGFMLLCSLGAFVLKRMK